MGVITREIVTLSALIIISQTMSVLIHKSQQNSYGPPLFFIRNYLTLTMSELGIGC